MRDYLVIGCTPADEPCFQVGRDTPEQMKAECLEFMLCLQEHFKEYGELVSNFRIKSFAHDFGTYCEVVCYYTPDHLSQELAFEAECPPERWRDYSRKPDWSKVAAGRKVTS